MARSSILGADSAPQQAEGRDAAALGPSDSSDSGSDIQGAAAIDAADELGNIGQDLHAGATGGSDAAGSGERGSAVLGENIHEGGDILPDRIGGSREGTLEGLDEVDAMTADDEEIDESDDEPDAPFSDRSAKGKDKPGSSRRNSRDRPR